jgi:pantoate--beta-alanine ligase
MYKMVVIDSIEKMQSISANWSGEVGFVPTMGYLHEGHLSLVKKAKENCEIVVVSIYVNPSQFAPNEDLDTYPRDFERDKKLLEELQVDYLFFPKDSEMYPKDYKTWVNVNDLTKVLCGSSRPTHFQGVTTIVTKLINIVNPDKMFMGEKDFQQITVLKRMVEDLNFRVKIIGCAIVREEDGLAMSSRNKNLKQEDREKALTLSRSIKQAKKMFKDGEIESKIIKREIRNLINSSGANVDYVEIVDPVTLENVGIVDAQSRLILAAYVGSVRLIDNDNLE